MSQDILPHGASKSNKKWDRDTVVPFILLPLLLLIATISLTITIIVMIFIGMGALYVQSRPRQKNRSPFFYSWTLSSGICMFLVYELGVLSLLQITQLENFIFLLLLAGTCYCFYRMKAIADHELYLGTKGKEYSPVLTSDSYYCQVCQLEVNERYFHSIWWDCCVFRPNYIYFVYGQIFAFATLAFGANLGLTTICHPMILFGSLMIPEDCTDAYFEFNYALCFVSCVYAIGYLSVIALVILQQLFIYLPKYFAPQWRRLVDV
ncbi:palmitoyltransferase ZDHHC23-A [Pieris brassicae]|nr:palmitoyltransferase ZDHHC23-A [Pieris brassicae]XP_045514764.1 palmitoyltransferase ZDHHC23-A [Pieris brassicae]